MTRDDLIEHLREQLTREQVEHVMEHVDAYAAELAKEPPEGWTAEEVAEFIGAPNPATARATVSRWGVKRMAWIADPDTGKDRVIYPADQVRTEYDKRRGT